MVRQLLYIPTHRRCLEAIEAYLSECSFLSRLSGLELPFLLIESRPAEWVPEHAAALEVLARASPVRIYHLTPGRRAAFVHALVEQVVTDPLEQHRLRNLLIPRRVSYGAGPNTAALAAVALGASMLLRRDSDTVPSRSGGEPRFPGELEIRVAGRPLTPTDPVLGGPVPSNVPVDFVASTYIGDPPLDRHDLLGAGASFLRRIERTAKPQLSDREIDDLLQDYLVDEMTREYDTDFLALDRAGSVEMGVSCLHAVFTQLPELPVVDTAGTDFTLRNILHALGRPVLFHSRKVVHRFDCSRDSRGSLSSAVAYAIRDLRHLLYWGIWMEQAARIAACPDDLWPLSGSLDAAQFCATAEQAVRVRQPCLPHVVMEFGAAHLAAADASEGESAARLLATGRAVLSDVDGHVRHVVHGVADHCFLVRHWAALVDVAAHSADLLDRLCLVQGDRP